MRLYTGTSGFSYKEWKGPFYPEGLKNDGMLAYYAGELPAVEINNTFYRMPKEEVIEGWASKVPEDFRFVLKASQRITHRKRLQDTDDSLAFMLEKFAVMGSRLGAILFQFPPYFKQDLERLSAFLELLPEGTRAAFEFRHESWLTDETYEALRARSGVLVVSDMEDKPDPPLVPTTNWGYLRLRRPAYSAEARTTWLARIRDAGWEECFCFFKHEDGAVGPRLAREFLKAFEDEGTA